MSEPDKMQQGVQSLEIGAAVAMALAQSSQRGISLSQVAAQTGMPASKAHRYLVSLCRSGLAEQDIHSGHYRLGWMAIELGLSAQSRVDQLRIADEILISLHEKCGLPVSAAIWTERGPLPIRKMELDYPLVIGLTRVGSRLPILNSSMGRLFAAYLPSEETSALIDEELASGAVPVLAGEKLDKRGFGRLLRKIREEGFALQRGDLIGGLEAIAAPVFAADGKICMCISISSLIGARDLRPDGPNAMLLRAAANELSQRLGFWNEE